MSKRREGEEVEEPKTNRMEQYGNSLCDKCIYSIERGGTKLYAEHIKQDHGPGDWVPFGANRTVEEMVNTDIDKDIIEQVPRFIDEMVELFMRQDKMILTAQQQKLILEWQAQSHHDSGFPAHIKAYLTMALKLAYALGKEEEGRKSNDKVRR